MLVDDTPANLVSLRAVLESADYDLVEAYSGQEALERLRTQEYAAVLLDVRMPGLNGFETARLIRADERSRHTPIMFLTADDIDRGEIERGYMLGAVDFFVKPLVPLVLQAKVRGFVELFREKQLARHEGDQLRLLVQGTLDYAIFMLDPRGYIASWNTGAERIKGYRADEIIGQHFSRFYPQEAIDRGWPDYELKVAAAEGRFEDEGWRIRKDGSQFWANVVITALRDENGELRGFSKVTRDLTERKDAEEALRRSEERFRVIVEGAKDYAIFMLDPQGHIASWNPGAERIKGYRADEIIGQHFSRFYPQEAIDRGWPDYELKVAAAEGRFEDEGWRIRKDGSQFWANVVITALHDERGNLRGFSKLTRDMTERKKAEEKDRRLAEEATARRVAEENARLIEEQRERLRVTLASIGDAVISTDVDGRVEFLNPVAEQLVGWKTGEAAGRDLTEIFRVVNAETRRPVENPALRDGRIVGLANHSVLIARDGAERPIDDSAAPIQDAEGRLIGSVLVFRDISERKRYEASLNERIRLLSLNAAVGAALVQGDGLAEMLQQCSEALITHLDGAFARVWTLNEQEEVLELRASAGIYTHLDGEHGRIPLGTCQIGMIAQERKPHLTNELARDPHVSDPAWAEREGMVSFAGYPLIVDGRLLGVMAMFARQTLSEATLQAMASVADQIAVGIERKRAEERLHEQRQWLAVTLASIGDAVIVTDTQGRVTFLNGVAEEITGWTLAEAERQPLEAVFPIVNERTREPVENPVEKVLREGIVVGLANHTLLLARDGVERPIDDSAAPIREETGKLLGVVLIFRDVTAQRRAEQDLRASEERLRLALDAARMWVWDWNIRTGALRWSDSLERLHGLGPGTFGGTFEELSHPDDREIVKSAIRRAVETGGEFEIEFRNNRSREGIRWITSSGKVFPGDDGRPLRLIGIGMDVTQRKRAERTSRFLADASAALAVLVDFDSTLQKVASLAVPYFADWVTVDVVEADGSLRRVAVSHVDPAKVQLAHELHRRFPPDPATPQGVWTVLHSGRSHIVEEITDEMLAESLQDQELLGILRDLGIKSFIGVPLTVRGKTLGVITFIAAESGHRYDATDLAVAEDLANRAAIAIENSQLYRELREADARKDEFLATLAHELRNPLAPIRNGLQVLRLAGENSDMAEEARSMMERQLGQMVRLVDDLLDVSRITRNKLELRKERVTLTSVVHSAVETSRPLIEQAGHTFSLTLPPAPVYLEADLTRLAQVFSNLLNNSAKYTEPGGRISLTAEVVGGEVAVRVRDNGLGIPAEAIPRLFQMFSQLDQNLERAQGGLGIGLTLVRRLTEMHGGTVEAHSEGRGRGSEFVVRLPVLEDCPDDADSQGSSIATATAKRKILVVDDNRDSALSLGMMLKLMGNEVRTANDGLAAIEAAEEFRPEMILLDIGLPKLNGYDACRRIREQPWSKGMILVALTGWGQEEDRRRSQEAGFDHHLVKPMEVATLHELLDAWRGGSGQS